MSNIFSLGWRFFLSNFKRLPYPYKLTFAITDRCNSACRHCSIWKKPIGKELTIDEIDRFFRKSNFFHWIDVTGGEIFLRNDVDEIFNIIMCRNDDLFLLHFPTNGLLGDRVISSVNKILRLKPKKLIVSISLDGPASLHDEIRQFEGSWKKSVELFRVLRRLRSENFEVYFGMTLSDLNVIHYEETIRILKEEILFFEERDLHINISHRSDHYYGNKSDLRTKSKDEYKAVLRVFRREKKSYINPVNYLEGAYLKKAIGFIDNNRSPFPCAAFSSSCFINSVGDIYPCAMWDNKVSNIKSIDYDLKGFWSSDKAIETAKSARNLDCPNCWTPCEAYQTIMANMLRFF